MASGVESRLARVVARYRHREEALARAREELLAAMVAARAAGATLARIAEIVGMSRQWLVELLERETGTYHPTGRRASRTTRGAALTSPEVVT